MIHVEIFYVSDKRSVFYVSRYQHLCDFARKGCGQLHWFSSTRFAPSCGAFIWFSCFPLLHLPADGENEHP